MASFHLVVVVAAVARDVIWREPAEWTRTRRGPVRQSGPAGLAEQSERVPFNGRGDKVVPGARRDGQMIAQDKSDSAKKQDGVGNRKPDKSLSLAHDAK